MGWEIQDYPLTRDQTVCPLCTGIKDTQNVACWDCWRKTNRLEHADMSRIDKFELALKDAAGERQSGTELNQMDATKNCPECGRTLDTHSPEGHCPRTEYLAALRDFVAAANRLHDAWTNTGNDDARGYPKFMPSFDEACGAFGDWLLAEHKE